MPGQTEDEKARIHDALLRAVGELRRAADSGLSLDPAHARELADRLERLVRAEETGAPDAVTPPVRGAGT